MMFPVNCRVMRPRYGLSADPSEEAFLKAMDSASADLSDKIIEAVVKQAAFSMGVGIALMFVPVIGPAISGLMSVTQQLLGKKYSSDVEKIMASTMADIQRRGETNKAEVMQVGQSIYMQEFPAIRALAMSQQTLDGIGSSFKKAVSRAGSAVSNAVKKIGDAVSDAAAKAEDSVKKAASDLEDQTKKIVKDPEAQLKFITTLSPIGLARLGIKYTITGAKEVAKGIESTGIIDKGELSDSIGKARNVVDDGATKVQIVASPMGAPRAIGYAVKGASDVVAAGLEATGNEGAAEEARRAGNISKQTLNVVQKAVTPTGAYNLMSGRELYLTVKAECERMRAVAFAGMDTIKAEAIAKLRSPEGRANIRKEGARAMRKDPAFLEYQLLMQSLDEQERMQTAQLNADKNAALAELEKGAEPSTTGGAGAAIGIAAAVVAAFALS